MIQTTPETIVGYAVPGLIALVGFFLLVRLALLEFHVLVFNQKLGVNVAVLVRWRADRHVVQHSVSSSKNDFAGRIVNRAMQTPSSVSAIARLVFGGMSYAIALVFGA